MSGRPIKSRYRQYFAPRDITTATNFWLSMGYNFGCVIAIGTIFDSRGGFSESRYLMKTEPILRF